MKKIFNFLLIGGLISFSLTSCSKQEVQPPINQGGGDNKPVVNPNQPSDSNQIDSSNQPSDNQNNNQPSDSNKNDDNNELSLTLKSDYVVASDLVINQNDNYTLNWEKFDTNINQADRANVKLENLFIDDRQGKLSFDLKINDNKSLSFNKTVEFNFNRLASLSIGWTNVKTTTTDASIMNLKMVTNSQQLSNFADVGLFLSDNDKTNYFSYLSKWFDLSLVYQRDDKKLETNEIIFKAKLENTNKQPFYKLENNNKQNQIWSALSSEKMITLDFPSDLSRAANDVVINTDSELFKKPLNYFYNTSDHTVDIEKLTIGARNEGLVKFQDSKYNNTYQITLSSSQNPTYNEDTNELKFIVQVKTHGSDEHTNAIFREFIVKIGQNQQPNEGM
ncbi:hypothetical protein [Mycoplasma bradburyae]|uniref:Lipoprotein n=1 Tax=Mycoplasma bradburyae TaxID=2963128 RepID=A0ABT5GBM3_9MOLU|nr:hypothetical protein [Mycoplasma bradburyae]MDC4182204.1 hypothetical protein [Mycoplasma bradburyae]UTS70029.1 hypothetical protein NMG68_03330 [Mycoplasma bradburyae]